jgi:hypothetical protein
MGFGCSSYIFFWIFRLWNKYFHYYVNRYKIKRFIVLAFIFHPSKNKYDPKIPLNIYVSNWFKNKEFLSELTIKIFEWLALFVVSSTGSTKLTTYKKRRIDFLQSKPFFLPLKSACICIVEIFIFSHLLCSIYWCIDRYWKILRNSCKILKKNAKEKI